MNAPIFDPNYWNDQLVRAGENLHLAVWCAPERWMKLHDVRHREILRKFIKPTDSVLDVGCAYGRLVDLMPSEWTGDYLGVDICAETVAIAQQRHPNKLFAVCDVRDLIPGHRYNWAVLVSFKHTVIANISLQIWESIERQLRQYVDNLLFLEWSINEEPDYGFERIEHNEWERRFQAGEVKEPE